ncbi:hypothetical protein M422DRAFT_239495 [Sphaerobolus stellatus SS14]|nr:hypothetical protein M422DRAFT_239495 [Sphaerobolus stellatus SS14]
MSDESKGAEAYSHLPSIIHNQSTPHSGGGLGPKLSTLCNNLLKLDHHDIACHIKEHAKEHEDLQSQLNPLQSSINRTPQNQPAPFQLTPYLPYYTPPPQPAPFPQHYGPILNGQQIHSHAAANAPATIYTTPPASPPIRFASAATPPIPTSFTNNPNGLRLYMTAIHTWDS